MNWSVPNLQCCDTVSVIRGGSLLATIDVDPEPSRIVFDGSGHAYLSSYYAGTVSILDTSSRNVVDKVRVGDKPSGLAFDYDNNKLYVPNFGSDFVSVIETNPYCGRFLIPVCLVPITASSITVGHHQADVEFDPINHYVYVGGLYGLWVLDVCSNAVIKTISAAVTWPGGILIFTPYVPVGKYSCGGSSTTSSTASSTVLSKPSILNKPTLELQPVSRNLLSVSTTSTTPALTKSTTTNASGPPTLQTISSNSSSEVTQTPAQIAASVALGIVTAVLVSSFVGVLLLRKQRRL